MAVRESRLVRVVAAALREIRSLLTTQDLRIAAAMNQPPALERVIMQRWHGYVEQMVQALLAPVRLTRGAMDPVGDAVPRSAEELARAQIGRLIRELSPAQLAAVRQQLANLLQLGPTPEVLGAIARATGLTSQQTQQVANTYRRALENGMAPGSAMETAQAHADRLLAQRAQTIARHEAVDYTNQVVLARGRAVDGGNGIMVKQWVSARDVRVDGGSPLGVCRQLDNNARIPIDEPFVVDGEAFDAPPAHIGCRCLLEIWRDEG
jgi:hypothetical protein